MMTLLEIRRQIFHLALGLGIIILYYFELIDPLMIFVIVMLGGFMCVLSRRIKIPLIGFFLKNFEREEQRKIFPGRGPLFFFIGALLVMKLFEKDIALAAIMVLALGDSVSHIVGEHFGKIRNFFDGRSRKLFEGNLIGALAGCLGAWIFVPFPLAFLGSFAAMAAEALEFELNKRSIDDNLIVPLVAGTVMFLVRGYF